MPRYAFFYLMSNEPERIRAVVPEHVTYWKRLQPDQYLGGPFADRSGGLITFAAADLADANHIIGHDPFVTHDLVPTRWIKEWVPE